MPEPDLHIEQPPPPPRSGFAGVLARLAKLPPGTSVRLTTVSSENSAYVIASQLRTGRRVPNRPPGTWTFTARQIVEGPDAGKYGVWVEYTPPDTPTP